MRAKRTLLSAALTAVAVLGACESSLLEPDNPLGVTLTPVQSSFLAEDVIELRLRNGTTGTLTLGTCDKETLQRKTGGEWIAVGPTPLICTLQGRDLRPGAELVIRVVPTPDRAPGLHRYLMWNVRAGDLDRFVVLGSDEFRLVE